MAFIFGQHHFFSHLKVKPNKLKGLLYINVPVSYYLTIQNIECYTFVTLPSQELDMFQNHKFTCAINIKTLKCHSIALYLICAYEISSSVFGSIFCALNLKLFHTKISSHFTPSAALEFPLSPLFASNHFSIHF